MSERCVRFEAEALLLLERGEALAPHFRECEDCVTAAAAFERVRHALRAPIRQAPSPGWERRVWAKIAPKSPGRRLLPLVPFLASVAAAGALLFLVPRFGSQPTLAWELDRARGELMRSGSARPGDVLRLEADGVGRPHLELRLYRDGVLEVRCSDGPPCSREGSRLRLQHPLTAVGRYEAAFFLSERPLLPFGESRAGPTRERDLETAAERQVDVVIIQPVEVF